MLTHAHCSDAAAVVVNCYRCSCTMRLLLWIVAACLVLTQVSADRRKEHKTEWKSNAKQHHVGHWGEHWTTTDKPNNKANNRNVKEVIKHAPGIITHHEARLQSDLGYRKRVQDKHREHDDLHLQDLTLGESLHHDNHQPKQPKPVPHHLSGHQIQSNEHRVPTHSSGHHMAHPVEHQNSRTDIHSGNHHPPKQSKPEIHRNPYKNMHIPPEVTKSHPDKKDHKLEKKYPKKFNKAKHEKKVHKVLSH